MKDEELSSHLIRFYEYFTQYDSRRNLNFLETFPEMKDFWNEAKSEYEENMDPMLKINQVIRSVP